MSIKFDKKEIDELMNLLKDYPHERNTVGALLTIQKLADELKFPVDSYKELVKQVGTDKQVVIGSKTSKIEELAKRIPALYYPFADRENFIEKTQELFKANAGDQQQQHHHLPVSMNRPPPTPAGFRAQPGAPATHGFRGQMTRSENIPPTRPLASNVQSFTPVRTQDISMSNLMKRPPRPQESTSIRATIYVWDWWNDAPILDAFFYNTFDFTQYTSINSIGNGSYNVYFYDPNVMWWAVSASSWSGKYYPSEVGVVANNIAYPYQYFFVYIFLIEPPPPPPPSNGGWF